MDNKIFFESIVPFEKVNIEDDDNGGGLIPTRAFLDAAKCIVQFVDLLGATFKPVKSDIEGNINKLLKLYESDPAKYTNLNDIVKTENATLSASDFHIGTDALQWLNRALIYNQTFLMFFLDEYRNISDDDDDDVHNALSEDINKHFTIAYELTLKKHHNWFVQKIFSLCLMAAPSRTSLLTYLGYLRKPSNEEAHDQRTEPKELKRTIIETIGKYLSLLKANTDAVSVLLLSYGFQP